MVTTELCSPGALWLNPAEWGFRTIVLDCVKWTRCFSYQEILRPLSVTVPWLRGDLGQKHLIPLVEVRPRTDNYNNLPRLEAVSQTINLARLVVFLPLFIKVNCSADHTRSLSPLGCVTERTVKRSSPPSCFLFSHHLEDDLKCLISKWPIEIQPVLCRRRGRRRRGRPQVQKAVMNPSRCCSPPPPPLRVYTLFTSVPQSRGWIINLTHFVPLCVHSSEAHNPPWQLDLNDVKRWQASSDSRKELGPRCIIIHFNLHQPICTESTPPDAF